MTKYQVKAKVIGQRVLNATTKEIDLWAPEIARTAVPGQFVNVRVSTHTAPLLRRPLGVARVNRTDGTLTLMYRVLGEATQLLANCCSGDVLDVLGPLGSGVFSLETKHALLVGGGLGLAPLLYLATELKACGAQVDVLMGGRNQDDLFWEDIFKDEGVDCIGCTTDDGSYGTKGTVMALLPQMLGGGCDRVYVCGPVPMMKAVSELVAATTKLPCQVSLERYMGCGLGACLTCSCQGTHRRLKVCTDGPVFDAEEVEEW